MEMLPTEDDPGDFWSETYLPLFRAIKQGGYVEPFLYTILSSTGKDDVSNGWIKTKGSGSFLPDREIPEQYQNKQDGQG
jgi:hypothetical protein